MPIQIFLNSASRLFQLNMKIISFAISNLDYGHMRNHFEPAGALGLSGDDRITFKDKQNRIFAFHFIIFSHSSSIPGDGIHRTGPARSFVPGDTRCIASDKTELDPQRNHSYL